MAATALFVISNVGWGVNLPAGTYTHFSQLPSGYLNGMEIAANDVVVLQGLTIGFNTNAAITVGQGAHLTLDGTHFYCTSSNNLWAGILLNGDPAQSHYTTNPTYNTSSKVYTAGTINSAQTSITTTNNVYLRNATNAIKSVDGALVTAADITFEDCIGYIKIEDDASYNPPHPNHSITDCIFKMPYASLMTSYDIKMIDLLYVDMVTIGGCTFENTHVNNPSNIVCPDERGIAINADKSTFSVNKNGGFGCKPADCVGFCGSDGCTFNGFYKAINIDNPPSPQKGATIMNATFNNNFFSIYSTQSSHSFISENTFNATSSTLSTYNDVWCGVYDPVFIYYMNNSNLVILDNTFDYTGTDIRYIETPSSGNGLVQIKKNSINNSNSATVATDNVEGIYIAGADGNTKITCNTFTNMGTDIYAGGKLDDFGTASNEAANVFSDVLSGRRRINSPSATQIYYYFSTMISGMNPAINSVGVSVSGSADVGVCTIGCSEDYVEDLINTFNLMGTEKLIAATDVSVYPNPSAGVFNIQTNFEEAFNIYVYDISGKTVLESKSNDNIFQIDLSAYNTGIYFVKIVSGQNTHTAKVQKQ